MSFDMKFGLGGGGPTGGFPRWNGSRRDEVEKAAASSGAAGGSEEAREPAAILIVEDEALNALYMSSVLEVCGYAVVGVTASASEALDVAAENVPDLVLMDITLRGDVDGIAAARSLKAQLGVPILFVTAHADAPTLARARTIDPAGFLIKPFTAQQLEAAIRKALATA